MTRKYDTEEDIVHLVRSFENATITREEWKHREHLVVALYYVTHHDVATAIEQMRSGILNLLANGFKLDLSKEMPYHETITLFWTKAIAEFHAAQNGKLIGEMVDEMVGRFDKDYPLRFYSRELLFSDTARAEYVEPDL
jgi:hypothetical protein